MFLSIGGGTATITLSVISNFGAFLAGGFKEIA